MSSPAPFVVDISHGAASTSAAQILGLGATGVIPYAGCDDPSKNVPASRFTEYLTASLWAALVIENGERDLEGGAAAGAKLGSNVVHGARSLGYDVDRCVLFTAADFNAGPPDFPKLLAGWNAYTDHVAVPGYYGDSDSADYLFSHAIRPPVDYWQSESVSFSPVYPAPFAHLVQRFDDPRAGALPVDVNDIQRHPLRFMGETMTSPSQWGPKDFDVLATELIKRIPALQPYNYGGNPDNPSVATVLHVLEGVRDGAVGFDSLPSVQQAILDAIGKIPAPVVQGQISGQISGTVTGP